MARLFAAFVQNVTHWIGENKTNNNKRNSHFIIVFLFNDEHGHLLLANSGLAFEAQRLKRFLLSF